VKRINLIPKEIILLRNKKRKRNKFIAIVILLNIVGIILFYIINREIATMARQLNYTEQELESLKYELKNLYNSNGNIDYIRITEKIANDIQKKRQIQRIQIIKNIMEKIPENVTVELIKIDESNNLVIEGAAESLQSIAKFIDSIKMSPFIDHVRVNYIKNTNAGPDNLETFYVFQLKNRIIGD